VIARVELLQPLPRLDGLPGRLLAAVLGFQHQRRVGTLQLGRFLRRRLGGRGRHHQRRRLERLLLGRHDLPDHRQRPARVAVGVALVGGQQLGVVRRRQLLDLFVEFADLFGQLGMRDLHLPGNGGPLGDHLLQLRLGFLAFGPSLVAVADHPPQLLVLRLQLIQQALRLLVGELLLADGFGGVCCGQVTDELFNPIGTSEQLQIRRRLPPGDLFVPLLPQRLGQLPAQILPQVGMHLPQIERIVPFGAPRQDGERLLDQRPKSVDHVAGLAVVPRPQLVMMFARQRGQGGLGRVVEALAPQGDPAVRVGRRRFNALQSAVERLAQGQLQLGARLRLAVLRSPVDPERRQHAAEAVGQPARGLGGEAVGGAQNRADGRLRERQHGAGRPAAHERRAHGQHSGRP